MPPRILLDARLRALLDADRPIGIRAVRNGKINRAHYAKQLGVSSPTIRNFSKIFEEYEAKLGIVTGPMRHFQDMRTWLHTAYSSKTLGFSDGKVDRAAFAKQFGLRGGTFMVRHPEIRSLFEELDRRANEDNYTPEKVESIFTKLLEALKNNPTLNKNGPD